jgi:hypothetical protein
VQYSPLEDHFETKIKEVKLHKQEGFILMRVPEENFIAEESCIVNKVVLIIHFLGS